MKTVNLVAAMPYHGQYQDGDFIGVDSGATYLYEKKIEMKALIGDLDSLNELVYSLIKDTTKVLKLDPIKDETDLEVAINYSLKQGYEVINVYGAIGGRLDHTIINMNLLKKYPMLMMYDDYSKVFYLEKGSYQFKHGEYKYYSFFAIKETTITLENFKYPLDNYNLKLDDTLCISNELKDNAKIEINEDIIVVLSK